MNKTDWLKSRESPTWRVRDLMEENAKLRDVLDAWSKASWFAGVPAVPDRPARSNPPNEDESVSEPDDILREIAKAIGRTRAKGLPRDVWLMRAAAAALEAMVRFRQPLAEQPKTLSNPQS